MAIQDFFPPLKNKRQKAFVSQMYWQVRLKFTL